jgi:uncharacterized protein (DUF2141 family)
MSSRGSTPAPRAYSEVIFWRKFFSLLTAFCVALFIGCCAEAAAVKITVENVRVGRGKLHLALFNSDESWDREDSILDPEFPPTQGRTEIFLDLPPGHYGFFIYNDENGNGKLDKTWIGFPNEPYAFSRNYKLGMHKPSFEEFSFTVPPNGTTMTVRLN